MCSCFFVYLQAVVKSYCLDCESLQNAAIYLLEGESNDNFAGHPQGWWSSAAFDVVHNEVYQYIQLAVSLLLMGLAIIEHPSYVSIDIPPRVSVRAPACVCVAVSEWEHESHQ